jgi:DNA-binding beta-propeller fold protein YncE
VEYGSLQPGDPSRVGSYRLIGRLGEGGMGRVFLGLSPGGRQVAVKLIHSGQAGGKQFRERFAREIDAARRVGGFHTAPVVDADSDADPPWMVTAYIHGPSLQAAVLEHGPLGLEQVRALGAGLAEGLTAIHACGLVHRDLKPSNVILADDGPRIIDFGIARAAQAGPMTTTGFVVGTYSYMSPEQMRGETAGPASDVFSLGCTLAFAASARAPFGDESIVTVVHRITSEPPDLSDVTQERGFRQLISECLAKSPDDRPALADILTRLTETVTDAAVVAEPVPDYPPAAEPPAYDAVAAEPSGRLYAPTQTMRGGDRTAPGRAADPQSPGRAADPRSPGRELTGEGVAEPDSGEVAESGSAEVAEPGSGERRSARQAPRRPLLIAAGVVVIGLLAAGLGVLLSGSSSPKPAHLAAGRSSPRPTVSASPAPPTQPEATLHDPKGKNVFGVVFSSDTVLATGDSNGSTYLWNAVTGKRTATLRDSQSYSVNSLAFSKNSDTFAAADANRSIYLWDAATGKLTATLRNPNAQANDSVAFSPDGGFVAAGNQDGSIYLWDVATGKLNSTAKDSLRDPGGKSVYGIAFSPDGASLAAGDTDGVVYLWNVATGKLSATFHDPDSKGLYDVAFSPDGSSIAVSDTSSAGSGIVYLWNVATGKRTAALQSIDGGDYSDIAFSPNGRFLAAADTDGSVILWNVAVGKFVANLPDPAGQSLIDVAFSPNGESVANTDTSGDTYIWNMRWLG